ncbi:hypothetical protein HPB50_015820 [Hyalomma asiaticum]|uniref:Uncharacterized protein n=1 Tax=Hyalomma asiaticum TaxID=266040 RepID=A0ACB7RXR9_HYAAI|nr:hypothetical protein HPB50_015820 [Hyalomma asiaticum]
MGLTKTIDGIPVPRSFPDDAVVSALSYVPRPEDVFVVTFPKCGTTWVQCIAYGIYNNGELPPDLATFLAKSPYIDLFGAEAVEAMPRPGIPYDVCVSLYNHIKSQTIAAKQLPSLDKFLQSFVAGDISFGSYLEGSLLPWYSRRNDGNVLFLTYEDLLADVRLQVVRIAEFLGKQYARRMSTDPAMLQRVVDMSSKESMRPFFRDFITANYEFVASHRKSRNIPVTQGVMDSLAFLKARPPGHEFCIAYRIYNNGKLPPDLATFLAKSPYIDLFGADAVEAMPRPGTIKTHLPFDEGRFWSHAKYIYVARNPYDVCVSLYNHLKTQTTAAKRSLTFDEFLQFFVGGKANYGSYLEGSLLPWYSRRNESNVLLLTYEDLHADIKSQVMRIAGFLGKQYARLMSRDPAMLQRMVDMSSKQSMRPFFRDLQEQQEHPIDPGGRLVKLNNFKHTFEKKTPSVRHLERHTLRTFEEQKTQHRGSQSKPGTQPYHVRALIALDSSEPCTTDPLTAHRSSIWSVHSLAQAHSLKHQKWPATHSRTSRASTLARLFPKTPCDRPSRTSHSRGTCSSSPTPSAAPRGCSRSSTTSSWTATYRRTKRTPYLRLPFLEVQGAEAAVHSLKPGAFKTHLPFWLNPYSPDAKYIYVARNPYDCCVSFYHHTRNFVAYHYEDGTFDDFLEKFVQGKVDFGDFFDHLLSWYEHRDDSNVLFLTFEGIKLDPKASVLRVAEFMGDVYGVKLRNDEALLEKIVNAISFQNMKHSLNSKYDAVKTKVDVIEQRTPEKSGHPSQAKEWHPALRRSFEAFKAYFAKPMKGNFARKGVVGPLLRHLKLPSHIVAQREKQDLDGVARSRHVGSYVFCEHFPEEILRGALAYRHRPGEVCLVTYPKCGTTWMQHILYHVYTLGEPPPSVEHFFRSMPFLERHGVQAVSGLSFPGSAIKTHMLYDEDRICPEAKYIYVVRNPLDCCVSFYHHYKLYPIYRFERGTFDEFFELFLAGDVDGGDYFDHLLSWYPHRNDRNVFFIRYEDLKKDTKSWILALADFLGAEYGDALRSDPEALAKVLKAASVAEVRRLARLEREYQADLMAYTPRHR